VNTLGQFRATTGHVSGGCSPQAESDGFETSSYVYRDGLQTSLPISGKENMREYLPVSAWPHADRDMLQGVLINQEADAALKGPPTYAPA